MLRLILGRLVQIAVTLVLVSAATWLAMGLMPGDPVDLALMSDPLLTARMRRGCGRCTGSTSRCMPATSPGPAPCCAASSAIPGCSRCRRRRCSGRRLAPPWCCSAGRCCWRRASACCSAPGARRGRGGGAGGRWRRDPGAIDADLLARHPAGDPVRGGARLAAGRRHGGSGRGLLEAARFLVLPVATLAIVNLAAYARHAMAAMQAELGADYIRTARDEGAVGARHALAPRLPQCGDPGGHRAGAGCRRAGLGRAGDGDDLRPPRHGQADLRRHHGQRLQPRLAGAAAGGAGDHAGDAGGRYRAAADRPELLLAR